MVTNLIITHFLFADPRFFKIDIPMGLPKCVFFGVTELQSALKKLGYKRGENGIIIQIKISPKQFSSEEAFSIHKEEEIIKIIGSDPIGAMYGLLQLAEDVERLKEDWLINFQPTSQKPFLRFRADNLFISVLETQGSLRDSKWFFDPKYWHNYFAMLARSRYNFCDFHAMYILREGNFSNFYVYFVSNHEHPEYSYPFSVEEVDSNLSMFNRIIDIAEGYGIKVALINYHVGFYAKELQKDSILHKLHTRWCVKEFLRRCPKLAMLGFRIGESGQGEEFYEDVYLKAIEESGKNINLYTRTWVADIKKLKKIGKKFGGKFFIEIKYNGEHLGAPYHAIHGYGGSYSYQNYLNYPRYWEVIWQIRANGTHRIFRWGDPEFIRRVVLSCKFGDGIGFTLEPITTYYYQEAKYYFKDSLDGDFLQYIWEKHWYWYLMWGRLAYDPSLKEDVWIHHFEKRFGKKIGKLIYQLLVKASKIIPLIYTYHCLGLDHRAYAPELEPGNGFGINTIQDGPPAPPQDIDGYLKVKPLDSQVYETPISFVEGVISGKLEGKITPPEVQKKLDNLAKGILQQLPIIESSSNKEIKDFCVDLKALSALALYYRDKDKAAVALAFYYKTGESKYINQAIKHIKSATLHWKELSTITKGHYKPLLEPLRMRTQEFTWESQLRALELDYQRLVQLKHQKIRGSKIIPPFRYPKRINLKLSQVKVIPVDKDSVIIRVWPCSLGKVNRISIYWKPLPSEYSWRGPDLMKRRDSFYEFQLPLTPEGLLYSFVLWDKWGNASRQPNVEKETPYFVIPPWNPYEPPD